MTRPNTPDHAFILAAGMGSRLRPYTDTLPKPLVPVNGKAMIDHTLDKLVALGIREVTVNLHYMADRMQEHLGERLAPRLTYSWERELLDTGGGLKKALYTMGRKPFFIFSGDTLWEDGVSGNTLANLAAAWDDSMDLLLLLQPVDRMIMTLTRTASRSETAIVRASISGPASASLIRACSITRRTGNFHSLN
jgi:MurNAc alpha-1-phosphate uridylyltransferase